MKGFSKTKSFKILMGAIIVLLAVILFTAVTGGSFFGSVIGFITTPMQSISAEITENVTDLEFLDLDSYTKEELKEMYKRVTEERNRLVQEMIGYEEAKKENEQLKKQLQIKEENPDMTYQAASVIGRDPNDVFYNFSIDKGYLAGVSVGDPVITEAGLIGVVREVYATTSLVNCLLSEDVSVAAMSKRLDESGVITSDVLHAANGTLRLNFLTNDTKIQEGTIITTSGAGGDFPKDLVIGYVLRIEQSENDISKYAVIQPYEDLKTVKDVQVMIGFPGKDEQVPDTTGGESSNVGEDPEAAE